MKKRNESGITLVALAITVIVMAIIAGISVKTGTDIIKRTNLENLRTNMLLIQAKTKEYVEEVNFKMGVNPDETKRSATRQEIYVEKGKLTALAEADSAVKSAATAVRITDSDVCYYVSSQALENMGLNQVKEENDNYYLVKFDETNITVEVYNTKGYNDNDTYKYSLTDIDSIE